MQEIQEVIKSILSGQTATGIKRLQYMPYKIDVAMKYLNQIGLSFEPKFELTSEQEDVYIELIKYIHGDPGFNGTLEKGLLLIGPSGTGKTLAMKIIQAYRMIDDTFYLKDGKPYRMNFDIYHVNDIVSRFIEDGFDGIDLYCRRYVACFDDIGTEIEQVKHYGNKLDVMSHIFAERYAHGLLTFGTSNFPVSVLEEKYDDRTISRMYALFNFVIMKGKDFRRT
ncbi:hypothetical protein [Sulfuricurvum sp. MLSB]|uniref:hypothetical protein n=1 Tax=Sulfuricurvum sp. MLSB TaxID=1537917 RepID=UPI000B1531EB|nr:hypothetical protein [Sulfuricurvum sp. MLSB]